MSAWGRGGRLVSVNLAATVQQAAAGPGPYRISAAGTPYVPAGDGGIVLGLRLGAGVFEHDGDHAAPGACLTHPDPAAAFALSAMACAGNPVEVRTGAAAGGSGAVLGKRGEPGSVIAVFTQDVLRLLRPGDQVAVRGRGQGAECAVPDVAVRNAQPELLDRLPVAVSADALAVRVSAVFPGRLAGNGIGRPTAMWDIDLQLDEITASRWQASRLRLGDLVAIDDIDASFNAGYRRGWRSIGLVVHGGSPQPGHGPGVIVLLSGPAERITIELEPAGQAGLDEQTLLEVARAS